MTMQILRTGCAAVGVIALVACGGPAGEPAETMPETAPVAEARPPVPPPPVSVNEEMVALVDHAGHALWDVEKEGMAPASDEDWATVAEHATQLAATGSLLMLGGQGTNDLVWRDDPEWRRWSRELSDAGLAALQAARAQDFDALVAANGRLVDSCEGCHQEFKPELPSEGIVHTHTH